MAFNPASLDTRKASDEGVWFTLTDMDGEDIIEDEKPVQIKLYGKDSAIAKEAISQLLQGGDQVEAIAAMIKEWSDNLVADSAHELAQIPHIADWVFVKVKGRANFTTTPSKN